MEDGRCQIIAFMLPGDSCDIGVSRLDRRDHSLVTLDKSDIAHAPDSALLAILEKRPRLASAFQWAQLVEAGITREWLLNIGQRDAGERMAHLFCEVYHRMKALGLSEGLSCRLRLTQTELGDVVSLSAVHVNRTLQALRHDGLIAYGSGRLTILDLAGLEDYAQFDPTYLHLPTAPPVPRERPSRVQTTASQGHLR